MKNTKNPDIIVIDIYIFSSNFYGPKLKKLKYFFVNNKNYNNHQSSNIKICLNLSTSFNI